MTAAIFTSRCALFKLLDDDAAGVGHFLLCQHEHLFANQLGGHEALGLVGDLAGREVLRTLGQVGDNLIQQQFEPVFLGGGDRDHLGEAVQSGVALDDGQQTGPLRRDRFC